MPTFEVFMQKVPYLAAVIFVVIIFVRAWQKDSLRREREQKRRDEFDLARMKELERIGLSCHNHTNELNMRATKAIDNAARIIEANTKVIGAIERRLNNSPCAKEGKR